MTESGFQPIPRALNTQATRGRTPWFRHRTQRYKVSVISGFAVSPRSHRRLHLEHFPGHALELSPDEGVY